MFGVISYLQSLFPSVQKDSMEDTKSQENGEKYQDIIEEVYDIIKDIKDPEREQTLEELNVVDEDLIKVDKLDLDNYAISIGFVPTVPHCSLATLIGLCMRVKLEQNLPFKHKLEISIAPGTHSTADEINKQINDKERVAAAMENPNVMEVVQTCLDYEQV